MASEKAKIWYLKNLEVLSHLNEEAFMKIAANSVMKEVKRKDVLYFQGSTNGSVILLKTGAVKITRLTPSGNEIILDVISAGSVLGDMTEFGNCERDESAIVVEDGVVCLINRDNFNQMLKEIPDLAVKVTKFRALKLYKVENRLLDLLYRTVEQRVAATLLGLMEDFGRQADEGHLLNIKLTHKDFADLVASTRETVTSVLNKLKDRGLIDFQGKYVLIKSVDGLKGLLETIAKA